MPRSMGDQIGGIRTVADIRLRCFVNPDTHCWEWRGATQKRKNGAKDPRVWMADARRTDSLPRAAWLLSGKPTPAGKWTAWRRCGCDLCGNPAHLMVGTKAAWGTWVQDRGDLRGRPERSAVNRRIKIESGKAVLTMELAAWIRESDQNGREIARALGVTESAISRCRRYETWAPVTTASIFAFAASKQFAPIRRAA